MSMPLIHRAGVLALLLVFGSNTAQAICVEDGAALFNALKQWSNSSSGTLTQIKVARSASPYSIQVNLGQGNDDDGGELQLLGGYQPGTNCSAAGRIVDPTNTTFDGGSGDFGLYTNGPVTIDGIRMTNYTGVHGVFVWGYTGDAAITLRRFIGVGNREIELNTPTNLRVENCLVHGQPGALGVPAFAVETGGTGVVTNCTVADNGGDGMYLQDFWGGNLYVYNTIVWGSQGTDITTDPNNSNAPYVFYSTYKTAAGTFTGVANLSSNPKFIGGGNYHLETATLPISPAIDHGTTAVIGGVPNPDIEGNQRPFGIDVDQGAYESTYDGGSDFVVTSSGDGSHANTPAVNCNTNSTTCTLREAIVRANASGTAAQIRFQLACPTQILLGSPLPNVTGKVTIDGTTQAGWTPNTNFAGFNANLCVLLNGAGSRTWALHVASGSGNARLIVQGLMFAGFTDAAIKLEDGSHHAIRGNQFGGIPFTLNSNDAIRVTGNTGTTYIGGYNSTAVYNLIVGSSQTGIYLDNPAGASVIAGNVIGIAADGASALGNGIGVFMYNSPNNVLQYNLIGDNTSYGVEIAAASGNVLQNNVIGETAGGANAGNGDAGVFLFGSNSHDNVIGASAGTSIGGNTIGNSAGAGVYLSNSAGAGNRIVGNSIRNNSGLAIDLGGAGPTANDVVGFDGDTGPNNLQNYPVPTYAVRTPSNEVIEGVLDSFNDSGAGFRIDFYYASACSALGSPARGNADLYLGWTMAYADLLGHAQYSISLPAPNGGPALGYISATATAADGSTSEIGECHKELPDVIFKDGFGGP